MTNTERHVIQDPIYVFVTGWRNADTNQHYDTIHAALERVGSIERGNNHRCTLVHGDYRGVDHLATNIVTELLRWRGVMGIPARWDVLGKRAGPTRNEIMLRMAMMLKSAGYEVRWLAFPSRESVGTWGCVQMAKDAGFEVAIHHLDKPPAQG